jgi:hypothetical protein
MSESEAASTESDLEALKALQTDASELERIETLLDRFNVFEAIGFIGQEVMHSRFLAFLLDPKQNHGLGDVFLRKMLEKASATSNVASVLKAFEDTGSQNIEQTAVQTEVYTGDGRVDILLLNEVGQWATIIENKVWSTEHSDQLGRYYRFVKRNHPDWRVFGIYLTPYGARPSHKEYLSLDYGMVCEIIDSVLEDQGLSLNPDVKTSIEHYTNMVRRNVVGDSDIAKLCQQIYQKHKRALDLIYEHRPDVQARIRDLLKTLIRDAPSLEQDSRAFGNFILRFAVREWDTPALLTANGWTGSGCVLLLEFWNYSDRLELKLIIGPGADEIHQKLLDMVSGNRDVFDSPRNYVASHYEILSHTFLARNMYEDTDQEEREKAIRSQWHEFLDKDLPRIDAALKKESWIWEPHRNDKDHYDGLSRFVWGEGDIVIDKSSEDDE